MREYSSKRNRDQELNREISYVKNLLEGIDREITLPESLSSRALLPSLANLEEEPRPRPRPFPFFPKGMMSLQSGISYAIALALVLVVFYTTQMGPPPVIDSQFALDPSSGPERAALFAAEEAAPQTEQSPALAKAAGDDPVGGQDGRSETEAAPHGAAAARIDGVGGPGPSNPLGEAGGYVLSWRTNDPADPDHPGRITLSAVSGEDESGLAGLVEADIPDMERIDLFYFEGDRLFLVGSDGPNTVLRCYSGFGGSRLAEQGVLTLPGSQVGARIYQGHAYAAALDESGQESAYPVEALPYSLEEGTCYVGVLLPDTGETLVKGYSGSGGEVALFDHHLYITYQGALEEGGGEPRPEPYIAQVKLEGLGIELDGVN